jgi:hypothetical protein
MTFNINVLFTKMQDKSDKASDEAYVEEVYLRQKFVVQHKKWANQHGYKLPGDNKVTTAADDGHCSVPANACFFSPIWSELR